MCCLYDYYVLASLCVNVKNWFNRDLLLKAQLGLISRLFPGGKLKYIHQSKFSIKSSLTNVANFHYVCIVLVLFLPYVHFKIIRMKKATCT